MFDRLVLSCEHASNRIPRRYRTLGIPEAVREGHTAYDPGALKVARALSAELAAPLFSAAVSRLE